MSDLTLKFGRPEYREVPVKDFLLDLRIQRKTSPVRVKRMVENMNLDALGTFSASERGKKNLSLWLLDGGHRAAALLQLDMGDWPVRTEVFSGLSRAAEAELFLLLNATKAPTPWEKYKAALVHNDPECCAIDAIVQGHGLRVYENKADGNVACPATLRKLYKAGGINGDTVLSDVLALSVGAWGRTQEAMEGKVLEGLGLVMLTYNGDIDSTALERKLAKVPGGAAGLIGKAKALRDMQPGMTVYRAIANYAISLYNQKRRSGRLSHV
jgi:hypothetical protein